jgi:hypothetical protein
VRLHGVHELRPWFRVSPERQLWVHERHRVRSRSHLRPHDRQLQLIPPPADSLAVPLPIPFAPNSSADKTRGCFQPMKRGSARS